MKLDKPVHEFCQRHQIKSEIQQIIVQYMMEGLKIEEISYQMNMSIQDVKGTMCYIYKSRGFNGRVDIMSDIYKETLRLIEISEDVKKIEQIKKILGVSV